jgi:hypothetical protein
MNEINEPEPLQPGSEAGSAPGEPGDLIDEELDFRESSFDLQQGLDMTEVPIDTVPGELRDWFTRR